MSTDAGVDGRFVYGDGMRYEVFDMDAEVVDEEEDDEEDNENEDE